MTPPYDLVVDSEVLVDNSVAKSRGLSPHLIGVLHSELWRQRAAGLPNDHQMMDYPDLDQFIAKQGGAVTIRVLLDALDCIGDVQEALTVVSYRGTASASTR